MTCSCDCDSNQETCGKASLKADGTSSLSLNVLPSVTNLHCLKPSLKLGRWQQAQRPARKKGIVGRHALVIQHDVVRTRHARQKRGVGRLQQRQQYVHVVLVGLGLVGVADIDTHRQAN